VRRVHQLTVEDLLAELVFDLALNRTTQRTRTEGRVETDLDESLLGGRGYLCLLYTSDAADE
jgi:hypothetical protein